MADKSKERQTFGSFDVAAAFEAPAPAKKTTKKPAPAKGESAAKPKPKADAIEREATVAAVRQGFTSREGRKIDGRSLRATGRTENFGIKTTPELKEAMLIEAKSNRGITVGELLEEMWAAYQNGRVGG
jgi:hypothetical protein